MQVNNPFYQSQTQSGTGFALCRTTTAVLLKHQLLLFRRNARAFVLNDKTAMALCLMHANRHW